MPSHRADLYIVMGVARSATAAELRRAYRQLALAHHPDRAGAASAEKFAAIADAYRVLADPVARSAYDQSLAVEDSWRRRDSGSIHAGGIAWTVETSAWKASRPVPIPDLLPRLSGRLEDLVVARIAGRGDDGAIELYLNRREATTGGTAAIRMRMAVTCATCGGVARPRGVWCRTCEHDGHVVEEVPVLVRVDARTHPGTARAVSVPRVMGPPIRVRFFVRGLRPDDRSSDDGFDE